METAFSELRRQLEGFSPSLLLFFAGGERDFGELARRMAEAFPGASTAGCTSCGEICQEGLIRGGISVFAHSEIPKVAGVIQRDLSSFRFAEGQGLVEELLSQGGWTLEEVLERPQDFLFLVLSDGLSGMEEVLLASLTYVLPSVRLVGGSAGDDFQFQRTQVAFGGESVMGGAVLLLLEPGRPFEIFQSHGFRAGGKTFVPTSTDPDRRLIHRIDGRPAVEVLAEIAGMDVDHLLETGGKEIAARPVVFGQGGEGVFFIRAVMGLRGTSALMGGAVEEGAVLHLMEGGQPAPRIREEVLGHAALLPKQEGMLLFQCGGRILLAQGNGTFPELQRAMSFQEFPCAGFATYGEHFGPLQLNFTVTGVVFGRKG